MRGLLARSLRRRLLPYLAVFQADLASVLRNWVLRAWFLLTAVVALIAILDHADPPAPAAASNVVTAFLHPVASASGSVAVLRELLRHYLVLWVTFVVLLSAGTITSELGVVADSVLSRGVSRWQYFLGKLSARLVAVLSVYGLVMLPVTLVLWMERSPAAAAPAELAASVSGDTLRSPEPPAFGDAALAAAEQPLCLAGAGFALARVAAVLVVVVAAAMAFSAAFTSSLLVIAVSWMTVYGAGFLFALVDLKHVSPTRLLRELSDVLAGSYAASEQCWILAAWLGAAALLTLASGVVFARRDV